MKKLLSLLVILSVSFATCVIAQEKIVRMGTEGYYPPFNYFDSAGKVKGFDIDIGNALCTEMKVKCEWVMTDWDGIIPALNSNKFDTILASMSITDKRSKVVSFTKPYYFNSIQFVAQKESGLISTMPADLKGKIVGTQSGTTEVEVLEKYFPDCELRLYQKLDDALLDMSTGRIDLAIASQLVLGKWLAKDEGKCCDFVGPSFATDGNKGTGIAVRKEDEELRKALNEAITVIMANGTYEKIRSQYFDFDIMVQPVVANEMFK
ncbi:MAG: transporter substrate-binding domain-containing protein [Desulfobulbaceae bacterium]|nr:transporter substrate-binding domain-containing protein [Desulfobulbaceae bacterium]